MIYDDNTKLPRKIIQVYPESVGGHYGGDYFKGTALCDDGTVWVIAEYGNWRKLPDLPQT